MKNDKREITLNEKDSFQDMLEAEKGLMRAYCEGALLCKRKQIRLQLTGEISKVFEDIFFITDVLAEKSGETQGN